MHRQTIDAAATDEAAGVKTNTFQMITCPFTVAGLAKARSTVW
ncbi:hypothetical protein RRSWK_02237 [Rhodopirellula sp. SWK7]|nr:hypothetical protein RRSWK_02237 [Rhodopirellula sp. SWK7]